MEELVETGIRQGCGLSPRELQSLDGSVEDATESHAIVALPELLLLQRHSPNPFSHSGMEEAREIGPRDGRLAVVGRHQETLLEGEEEKETLVAFRVQLPSPQQRFHHIPHFLQDPLLAGGWLAPSLLLGDFFLDTAFCVGHFGQ